MISIPNYDLYTYVIITSVVFSMLITSYYG